MLPNLPTISLCSALPADEGRQPPAYPVYLLGRNKGQRTPASLRMRLGKWLIRTGMKLTGQPASGQAVFSTR